MKPHKPLTITIPTTTFRSADDALEKCGEASVDILAELRLCHDDLSLVLDCSSLSDVQANLEAAQIRLQESLANITSLLRALTTSPSEHSP